MRNQTKTTHTVEQEKTVIELGNKMVVLSIIPFDGDVDVDDLTVIHHHNIIGEILTVDVMLNRVGNLLADITEANSEAKLDFEIFEAQKKEEKRKSLEFETTDSKNNVKLNKPTVDEVNVAVIRDPDYKVKRKRLIQLQKQWDIVNSWYWAVQKKSEKLNKLSEKLRPDDFLKDILEETINGVKIQITKKAIS